jgi:hypothetical protein
MSLACRIAEPDLLRRTTASTFEDWALYLAGWVALNAQQLDLAQKLWQKALSLLAEDQPERGTLQRMLNELAQIQNKDKQRQTQHPPRFYIIRFFLYALFYSSNTLRQSWHFFTLDSYFCCCCI